VKRHPTLASLSRDHRRELVQARRVLSAADGDDDARLAAADAYIASFFSETVAHFRREEEELFPLYVRHAGSTPLLERVLREHMQLHGLARTLRSELAASNVAPETLRELGDLLREHVRIEERELFQEIQRVVPAAELARLT
jgi:hemerythrin-like domain-containing protein